MPQAGGRVGTVATVLCGDRRFYCVAYSQMNERSEATATVDGIWLSLSNLWNEVRVVSNGEPVAIGVVGGGQARVDHVLATVDSIRFIVISFVLASRKAKVCDCLEIVVSEDRASSIDMPALQAFLDSLGES
jgi:hypothetical protein